MPRLSNLIEGLSYTVAEEGVVNVLPKARKIVGDEVRGRLARLGATREKYQRMSPKRTPSHTIPCHASGRAASRCGDVRRDRRCMEP